MLISCHIPKTAGYSFATALREVYGAAFLWDMSHETILGRMFAEGRMAVADVPVAWLDRYAPPRLTASRSDASGTRRIALHRSQLHGASPFE